MDTVNVRQLHHALLNYDSEKSLPTDPLHVEIYIYIQDALKNGDEIIHTRAASKIINSLCIARKA